jgi:c-di-GMP-binding flagellar brake protein YcgR
MNVAEAKLAETINLLRKLSASIEQCDIRRAPRVSLRIDLEIRSYTDGAHVKTIAAEMQDISARGMAIRVQEPVAQGSTFLVQLPVENHDQPIAPLICQVIHCREQKDASYLIGAEFVGQMDTTARDKNELNREEERIRNSILS